MNKRDFDTRPIVDPSSSNNARSFFRAHEQNRTQLPNVSIDQGMPTDEKGFRRNVTTVKINVQQPSKLYEVKLNENDVVDKEEKKKKRSIFKSIRFYVMLITLISPVVASYSKNIINYTILRMIDPEFRKVESKQPVNSTIPYFDLDNSCPVSGDDRTRLLKELNKAKNQSSTISGERFRWTESQQGWLKASFSLGHIPLQIAGSRLAESYSAHRVLSFSILLTAIFSFLAPFMATIGYYLIFLDLFFLGIAGSFVTPALMTLFSNWLTPGEKSIMLTCYLITSRIGSALTAKICGFFIDKISWRYIFFSAGGANFLFVVIFFMFATSKPVEHFLISDEEVDYLASKNLLVKESVEEMKRKENNMELNMVVPSGSVPVAKPAQLAAHPQNEKKKRNPPWGAILTSVPVWSFVITKFCVKLSGDLVAIELPAYLDRVMHYSGNDNGSINSWAYIAFCLGSFTAGWLSKIAVKSRPFGLSKTVIRKIFQCFASFGVSLLVLSMAFNICESTPTIILIILWNFLTTFGTGGEQQIPFDITERYPGTIHAIASTLAISGVVVPVAVNTFLAGHSADQEKWKIIWYVTSSVAAFGGLVFLFGADARIQPFDSMNGDEEIDEQQANKAKEEEEKRIKTISGRNGLELANENKAYEDDFDAIERHRTELNDSIQAHRESRQI